MEIVTGAMTSLLPKLGELLKEEYKLQRRVRGEIIFLKAELESMQSALLKVSAVPAEQLDPQVKLWARDVREISYDIEDSVDAFMVRVDARRDGGAHHGGFMEFIDKAASLLTKAKTRRQIAVEVDGIKTLIKEVTERRDTYKVDTVVAAASATPAPKVDPRYLSALYKRVAELVGVDGPRDDVVRILTEQKQKVVSIFGFGGLGKTTVANTVYQQLKEKFDCTAFVSVSLNPDVKKVFKSMLHQLDKQKYNDIMRSEWDEQQLIDELRDFLANKRYFIVIDDIWDLSVWKTITYALMENDHESKIIMTTRNIDVAEQVGGAYKLKPLSLDDSKKLFYKIIYGCEDKRPPTQLTDVSTKILRKCGGLPLAIITIASLLHHNQISIKEWNKVHDSIGHGLEHSLDVNDMRRILAISYGELPSHLKACLLYLSIYPEDTEIITDQLIWRWIAEGFMHKKQGEYLYDLGLGYLHELINRSMIQPVRFDYKGGAKTCRVHDMVLDLIIFLSTEENFVTTIVGGQQSAFLEKKTRRLSLQSSKKGDEIPQPTMTMSSVRSLSVFGPAIPLMPPISSFTVLRVLELFGCDLPDSHCLKFIGNLFQLRYLRIIDTNITELPKEIGSLQFLQTLWLDGTKVRELPSTIVELRQLMCLCFDFLMKLPNGIGNIKSLHQLSKISLCKNASILNELGNLTELREVALDSTRWDKSNDKLLLQCLSTLEKLQSLQVTILFCDSMDFMLDSWWVPPHLQRVCFYSLTPFSAMPKWISSLYDLVSLFISLKILRQEDLQMLEELPALRSLSLFVKKPLEERLVIGTDYTFQYLTELTLGIDEMELMFAPGAMPMLQSVSLEFEAQGTKDAHGGYNFGLENLSSLENVSIKSTCYSNSEVDDVEAAIRKAIDSHPNHLNFEFSVGN